MEPAGYYRYEGSDIIIRRRGAVVEKKGADKTWKSAPELLRKYADGDVNLIEITSEVADPDDTKE